MTKTIWTSQQIAEKVKQILAEELDVVESEIVTTSRIQGDLGADSLDVMEIVMRLEETFEIEIPEEDVEKLTTYQEVVDYIVQKTIGN